MEISGALSEQFLFGWFQSGSLLGSVTGDDLEMCRLVSNRVRVGRSRVVHSILSQLTYKWGEKEKKLSNIQVGFP